MNPFLVIVVSISFSFTSSHPISANDKLCFITRDVLCVKDILSEIANQSLVINQTINKLEQSIINNVPNSDTLNRYVRLQLAFIKASLPKHEYHTNFFLHNNIDQKFLVSMISEAHDAMIVFYKSINDLTGLQSLFDTDSNGLLMKTSSKINDIICQCRSILNVYSYPWSSADQIGEIKFSKIIYRSGPSIVHDIHSIVIIHSLREWMQRLHDVISNLKRKFS